MSGKKKFKVLHLLGSVGHGGAEILFYDLAKFAENQNDSRFLFTYYGEGLLADQLDKLRFVRKINCSSKIKLILGLRRFIQINSINIVHVHSSVHLFYVFFATLGLSVKKILSIHSLKLNLKTKIQNRISFFLSNKVLFVSKSVQKKLLKDININTNKKFMTVYNGIDPNRVPSYKKKYRNSRLIEFGMVGNFYNDVRNHLILCKAALLLKYANINFRLYFAGGHSNEKSHYFNQCKQYVNRANLEEEVLFLGYRNDVIKLMQKWDIFVYASNKDTFGIAVVEAMMCGVPVIVNDLDVFEEITEKGKYATLYKTKKPENLASKIEDFTRNPNTYQRKADEASKYVRSKFVIKSHYKILVTLYNEALNN